MLNCHVVEMTKGQSVPILSYQGSASIPSSMENCCLCINWPSLAMRVADPVYTKVDKIEILNKIGAG